MRVLWMNCVHWTHGNISEHTMAHKPAIKWIENFVSAFVFLLLLFVAAADVVEAQTITSQIKYHNI